VALHIPLQWHSVVLFCASVLFYVLQHCALCHCAVFCAAGLFLCCSVVLCAAAMFFMLQPCFLCCSKALHAVAKLSCCGKKMMCHGIVLSCCSSCCGKKRHATALHGIPHHHFFMPQQETTCCCSMSRHTAPLFFVLWPSSSCHGVFICDTTRNDAPQHSTLLYFVPQHQMMHCCILWHCTSW